MRRFFRVAGRLLLAATIPLAIVHYLLPDWLRAATLVVLLLAVAIESSGLWYSRRERAQLALAEAARTQQEGWRAAAQLRGADDQPPAT